jgi:hypothetical protein
LSKWVFKSKILEKVQIIHIVQLYIVINIT